MLFPGPSFHMEGSIYDIVSGYFYLKIKQAIDLR